MKWKEREPEDFTNEIQAHLELEVAQLKAQGMSEDEARSAARRKFGNITSAQENFYETSPWRRLETLWRNVRVGARMILRNPGTSATVMIVLALGIGANTAIFTLLNALLLRNLHVQNPSQLVLFGKGRWIGSVDGLPDGSWQLFSNLTYREFQHQAPVFSGVAAIDSILFSTHGRVAASASPEKINIELVSGTYFDTLGVKPALGRVFTGADDRNPGGHPIAVASYSWWQSRLGRSPSAIGTTVTITGTVYTIVGVTPPGFFGMTVGQSPDLWVPLAMEKQISPGWNGLNEKLFQSLYIFARLKPGVSIAQANPNTNVLFREILSGYIGPQPSAKESASISHASIELTSAATGLSPLRQQFSSALWILMAVVGTVLLIVCTNVANLLMARAAIRRHEFAIRLSLGGSRGQIVQQLLVESGLLGAAAAALGIVIAWAGSRMLLMMVSSGGEVAPINVNPDLHVLGFTICVTVLTVLLFGTLPAFRSASFDPGPSLKEGRSIAGSSGRNHLTRSLVAGQIALSLALLSGASLFLRSLVNLMSVDPGFNKHDVLTTGIDFTAAGYKDDAQLRSTMRRIEKDVESTPAVRAASFAFMIFNGGAWTGPIQPLGRLKTDHDPDVFHDTVGVDFFKAMGMPIVLGRGLTVEDTASSRKVAVINETTARVYFPGGSPIGRIFSAGTDAQWQNLEVVGVVKDARYSTLDEKPEAAAFYPYQQHDGFLHNFVVRYTGSEKPLIPEIRKVIASVDSTLPLSEFSTMEQKVDDSVVRQRVLAQLSTGFGVLAALLACIGIYSVISYGITLRTNEFGIRMALGANRASVLRIVLAETLTIAAFGVSAGIVLELACGRLIGSMLFGLTPTDPVALGIATALMVAVALFAGWVPAQRATRIDPMTALRHE